jgi:hypothetical protein
MSKPRITAASGSAVKLVGVSDLWLRKGSWEGQLPTSDSYPTKRGNLQGTSSVNVTVIITSTEYGVLRKENLQVTFVT